MSGIVDTPSLFTAQDICNILSQCDSHRVKSLRIRPGELDISFYKGQPTEKINLERSLEPEYQPDNQELNPDTQNFDHEGVTELAAEMRRYELMTNDPLAYEQEMIDQQLNIDSESEAHDAEVRYWPTQ